MNDKTIYKRTYVLHPTGDCARSAVCSVCGGPITGAHYFVAEGDIPRYYHLDACVAASKLGAPDRP